MRGNTDGPEAPGAGASTGRRDSDRLEQGSHLLAGSKMGHIQDRSALVRVQVEKGQASGKQFAEDDPFRKARRQAETDAFGELLQQTPDIALVAGVQAGEAIAHDDP